MPVKKLKFSAFGVALICIATASSALTMGRARGLAILGRPLDVSVPVQLDSQEDASAQCFEADVFYGESRQSGNMVTVIGDGRTQAQPVTVRVVANANVNEPVVTMYLRAVCGQKSSRSYVLLADMLTELAPLPVATPLTVRTTVASASSVVELVPGQKSAGVMLSNGSRPIVESRAKRPELKSESKFNSQQSTKAAASLRPRLKLALMDLGPERDPTLKISDELMVVPVEDLQKRVEALALWRSLNATPQDVLRDGARLQAMDGDMKVLREQTVKNQKTLLDFAGRLERAEAERYANPLVYGLTALVAACGLGMAYAWTRLRRRNRGDAPWWGGPVAADANGFSELGAIDRGISESQDLKPEMSRETVSTVSEDAFAHTPVPVAGGGEVDIDLHLGESVFSKLEPASASSVRVVPKVSLQRDFADSTGATLRAINTQEMLDVRQQAEFFMTLGQHEDAIAILENCIRDNEESNPLVFLDLLKMLHTLSRKTEYDRYRDGFNRLFTGRVPPFRNFYQSGSALEAYPEVCSQIGVLWPSKDAVHFIENCLVRTQENSQQEFELEAFRDLLLLHGIAGRIDSLSDSGLLPFSASRTFAVPTTTVPVAPAMAIEQHRTADLDLDLDLSDPVGNLIEFDSTDIPVMPRVHPPKP
jgi:pilus assembly protein FimV